jgi:hypothetical protein
MVDVLLSERIDEVVVGQAGYCEDWRPIELRIVESIRQVNAAGFLWRAVNSHA